MIARLRGARASTRLVAPRTRLASPGGPTDALHIDNSYGIHVSGDMNAPATGGWQDWTTVTATVNLPFTGLQTLTVDRTTEAGTATTCRLPHPGNRRRGPLAPQGQDDNNDDHDDDDGTDSDIHG